jgi:hypothetical protein
MADELLTVVPIDFQSPGPFQLPLSVHVHASPDFSELEPQVLVELLSRDGKRIVMKVSPEAVEQFVNGHGSETMGNPAASASPIDLSNSAVAYRLPLFMSFDGTLQGPNCRTLIFSSNGGQKVWLPLDSSTYIRFLAQLSAALLMLYKKEANN